MLTYQNSLAEFFARKRKISFHPFSPAACTSEKTLLRPEVCERLWARVRAGLHLFRQESPQDFFDGLTKRPSLSGRPLQTVDKVGFCHCEPVSQHWCGNPYSPKTVYSLTFLPENGFPRRPNGLLGMTRFGLCRQLEAAVPFGAAALPFIRIADSSGRSASRRGCR